MSSIAAIVLAAGHSTRFGSDKMLHRMPGGLSVIETTVGQYLEVFECLSVVVGSAAMHPLRKNSRIKLIEVNDQTEGMSDSLKAGLRRNIECDGWLIALGDMPYIQTTSIETLLAKLTKTNIVLPSLHGRQGNPVGFGRLFRNQLMSLQGDKGAKSLIHENPWAVLTVPTRDHGVVHDIDIPQDIL